MKRVTIRDLRPGQPVNDLFLLTALTERAGRRGDGYVVLTLADRTGQVRAFARRPAEPLLTGEVLRVCGRTRLAEGELEMIAQTVEPVDPLSYHLADFTPVAPESPGVYLNRLSDLVEEVQHPAYRALIFSLLADTEFLARFSRAPASLADHHAYEGGLLQHTVEVMEATIRIVPMLRPKDLDVSLLLTAGFFHDIGKVEAYTLTYPYRLTPLGRWLGHEVLGLQCVLQALDPHPQLPLDARGRLLAVLTRRVRPSRDARTAVFHEAVVLEALDGLSAGLCRTVTPKLGTSPDARSLA